ncbi:Permease of the drug/metabolite transporter (DMT) superfamily [Salinihabitans flavidus]|uniref:Permease of the drug/metabolite transporter (DMT) superfamily n=1 Tax=Salinihabitans flavidus TaxID=569882 RepID=A0A1H8UNJ0_9RHOB|nr:DMT family transporter [Salinihabitans flavidus]SEP04762.1 Permease of the drug/metabolite transporter (DMT) superfamily [Salinihabitans flavidus]
MITTGIPKPNTARGVFFKLSALLLFAIMASLIKASAPHVPPWQAVFFRSFFAMIVIVIWLLHRRELHTGLRVVNPMGHFWRGFIGTTAMGLGFAGLGLLPFPEVTAIGFTAPLLTVVFASMFLGEQVRLFRLSAVGFGLLGVLVILYPRLSVFDQDGTETVAMLGAMLVLGSAVFRALAQVHIRRLVQTDQTSAIVFFFSLTATLLSLLTIPLGWVMPSGLELIYLVGAGLLGGLAQIFLTTSYRYAEASVLAPFDYSSMIYALLIGYFIFGEVPTLVMLIGASLIIGAGIVIIWRERQLGLERSKDRKTLTPQG